MQEFAEGRINKDVYEVFYTRFVPAVVGPDLFRQRIQDNKAKDPCTASDEAFALLLLENNYDRWLDIFDKNEGLPSQRRGDRTKQCDSDIEPKYTRGGIKFSIERESPKAKGWSNEGIERFNVLFKRVKKDRRDHTKFVKRLIKKHAKDPKIQAKKIKPVTIQAAHSLWDEEGPKVNESDTSSDDDEDED